MNSTWVLKPCVCVCARVGGWVFFCPREPKSDELPDVQYIDLCIHCSIHLRLLDFPTSSHPPLGRTSLLRHSSHLPQILISSNTSNARVQGSKKGYCRLPGMQRKRGASLVVSGTAIVFLKVSSTLAISCHPLTTLAKYVTLTHLHWKK